MKESWYTPYFKNKKITIMGLGLLGRGLGDAAFLASHGVQLLVTDKKTKEQLASSVSELKKYTNIAFRLGEHRISDFENVDMVVKAAGVPLNSEYIALAHKRHVSVVMSGSLLAQLVKEHFGDTVTIIGTTGTRGKSTTTALIAHILKVAGKKVHLAGNVRGVSNLALLPKIKKGDCLVMELDSWQLQGFGEANISPDTAVFTSFLDDHMNYYHNDVEKYFEDKAQIFKYQKQPCLFVSPQASKEIKKRYPTQKMIIDTKGSWTDEYKCVLIGEHNMHNIRLASLVAERVGISKSVIKKALATAASEAGRLQYIGLVNNIHVYDDNNATSPDAIIAGLTAVAKKYPTSNIYLLCGGAEKQSHLADLIKTVKKIKPVLYMLAGTGTDRFLEESSLTAHVFTDFTTAIKKVFEQAKKGDVFLFSPGFASFGMFVNEYDREDQFKKIIAKCKR